MRVLPFVFVIFLLASVLAVPTPLSNLENREEQLPALSSDWRIEVVDSYGDVGLRSSIALDSGGNPHISYWDMTNATVKYARRVGGIWMREIASIPDLNGGHPSLALDGDDNPHISYYEGSPHHDLEYAKWNGTDWTIETVDSFGVVGIWPSLALDSEGNPHISYWDYTNEDLKYATWNGTAWENMTVDSEGWVGLGADLALDSIGNPHISYMDTTNRDLKYARWNGTDWILGTVDSYGDVGGSTSIAIDESDNPHISYQNITNSDLKYARWDDTSWSIVTVDSVDDVGSSNSLALDSLGQPHISYIDRTNCDLKYAMWNGTAWSLEVVDDPENIGFRTSIAVDMEDNPHISYMEAIMDGVDYDYNLKYATKADLEPPEPALSYSPSSLDFGILPQGAIETKAFDVWNSGSGSLTYAFTESIVWVTDVNPPNGSSKGEHDVINVRIDITGLSEGLHEGSISITSNGGNGTVNVYVEVLAPSRTISLDIDPDTLNLKSKGRWITAYISAENASVHDVNISSILLQDTLIPERYDYQGDILMLKFNRQELQSLLQVGDSIEIKVSGKWNDGSDFEAYDYIRVIDPGKK